VRYGDFWAFCWLKKYSIKIVQHKKYSTFSTLALFDYIYCEYNKLKTCSIFHILLQNMKKSTNVLIWAPNWKNTIIKQPKKFQLPRNKKPSDWQNFSCFLKEIVYTHFTFISITFLWHRVWCLRISAETRVKMMLIFKHYNA